MQDGEYYMCFGSTAEMIADEFFNTRDVLKFRGPQKLASASVNTLLVARLSAHYSVCPGVNLRPQKLQTVLKDLLLERQMKVELWAKPDARGAWAVAKRVHTSTLSATLLHQSSSPDHGDLTLRTGFTWKYSSV